MILLRALVRVLSFLLLLALAAAGAAAIAVAVDPGWTAGQLGLPSLRDTVSGWFDALAADGPVAVFSGLGGLGAVLLGLLLLAGVLIPRRERLVALESTELGSLNARRRPLADVATQLVERTRGVTNARVKVKPRRRGGGTLRVRADRPRPTDSSAIKSAVTEDLRALTGPFKLKAAVQTRLGDGGARVQ